MKKIIFLYSFIVIITYLFFNFIVLKTYTIQKYLSLYTLRERIYIMADSNYDMIFGNATDREKYENISSNWEQRQYGKDYNDFRSATPRNISQQIALGAAEEELKDLTNVAKIQKQNLDASLDKYLTHTGFFDSMGIKVDRDKGDINFSSWEDNESYMDFKEAILSVMTNDTPERRNILKNNIYEAVNGSAPGASKALKNFADNLDKHFDNFHKFSKQKDVEYAEDSIKMTLDAAAKWDGTNKFKNKDYVLKQLNTLYDDTDGKGKDGRNTIGAAVWSIFPKDTLQAILTSSPKGPEAIMALASCNDISAVKDVLDKYQEDVFSQVDSNMAPKIIENFRAYSYFPKHLQKNIANKNNLLAIPDSSALKIYATDKDGKTISNKSPFAIVNRGINEYKYTLDRLKHLPNEIAKLKMLYSMYK